MFGWVLFRAVTGPNGSDDPLAFTARFYGELVPIHRLLSVPTVVAEASIRTVPEFFSTYEWIILIVGVITSQPIFGSIASVYRRLNHDLTARQAIWMRRAAGLLGDAYLATLFAYCLVLIAANTYSPFIYFQF